MSADKRSVSTDALETLGMIHFRDEHRDAIHLAVEPVTAGEVLKPGERIGLDFDHKAYRMRQGLKLLGIVDPFLEQPVEPGQRFWLVLLPRQVTSLRHVWSHPDFPDEVLQPLDEQQTRLAAQLINDPYHRAKAWMEDFLNQTNERLSGYEEDSITMEELMDVAAHNAEGGWESILRGSAFEGYYIPEEFWEHYEALTQKKVPPNNKNNFFSCAC